MSYMRFVEIGRTNTRGFGIRYSPGEDLQLRTVWVRLGRINYKPFNRLWKGIEGDDVQNLTVKLTGETVDAESDPIPDESQVFSQTTVGWDSNSAIWSYNLIRTIGVTFPRPVQVSQGTNYWITFDLGTVNPKYGIWLFLDDTLTLSNNIPIAYKNGVPIWQNSPYDANSWHYGPWVSFDTESPARGARYHVMINGIGYMTPGNLSSAISSTVVPFTGKLGGGRTEWSDMQFPYTADSWDNFVSGIGTERKDDNPSGYTIGVGIDTRVRGQVILAPAVWETSTNTVRPPMNFDSDHASISFPINDSGTWYIKHATPVQMPASSVTVAKIRLALGRYFEGPWSDLKLSIYGDNAGVPDTNNLIRGPFTITETKVNRFPYWYTIDFTNEGSTNWVTSGNEKVWVVLEVSSWDNDNEIPLALVRATNDVLDTDEYSGSFYPTGYKPKVWNGTTWVDATWNSRTWALQYDILDDGLGAQVVDFVYWPSKDKLYCVANKLWVWNEGTNKWDGYWSEVTGAGTGCQRAVVFNDKLYVSKGYSTQALESSDGTTFSGLSDGGNPVNALEMYVSSGFLWLSTGKNTVKKYNGITFSSDIIVGTADYDITGFALFQGQVHVSKQDGIWYIDDNDIARQRINYEDQYHQHNGRGIANFGELLYYNVKNSYMRWTGATLDFKGPYDNFSSVPETWTGQIVSAHQVGRHLYVALWASESGTSQVLAFSGIGWHPIYMPFGTTGNKVRKVYWTSGNQAGANLTDGGRLWIGEDSHVRFIELPDRTDNPNEWDSNVFDNYGWIELPWHDFGLREVDKFFRDVRLEIENFTEALKDNLTIRIGCYVNDGVDHNKFHLLGEFSPGDEVVASFPPNLQGKAVKILIGLETKGLVSGSTLANYTPVIRAITLTGLVRLPQSYSHSVQILLGDDLLDMHGERINRTATQMWDELRSFEASVEPLRIQFPWTSFDGYISNLSARTIAYREKEGWEKIAAVTFVEA